MLAPFWLQFCGSNRYFEDKRGTKDARLTTCVNWYNFRGNGFRQDPHGRLCDNIHSRGNRYDSVADTSWTKLGRGDENCPIDSIPRMSITFINVLIWVSKFGNYWVPICRLFKTHNQLEPLAMFIYLAFLIVFFGICQSMNFPGRAQQPTLYHSWVIQTKEGLPFF